MLRTNPPFSGELEGPRPLESESYRPAPPGGRGVFRSEAEENIPCAGGFLKGGQSPLLKGAKRRYPTMPERSTPSMKRFCSAM